MTKFHSIRDQLLDRLEGMAAGEQFPPERQLAETLGISRMTLRRAIDELVAKGMVRRRHGTGVFALGPKLDQPLAASSFTEDMVARGMRPGSHILSFDTVAAGAHIGRRLHLAESDDVIAILRLRLADDEPIALEELHIPSALVPGVNAGDLEDQSFYELLRQRFGVSLSHSVQTIEPTLLDAAEAKHLGVPELSPALLFERTSRGADDVPFEFVRSVYRGDRYKIRTELTVPDRGVEGRAGTAAGAPATIPDRTISAGGQP
ncbi:GntR family transcriptional regulator [Brevibacterium sp. FAM 25378]|uniref:GntR family transcriptional regulator n=1 Tax=unclassified Brevibacterium TaxID=2614124 RepID=UPI001091F28F|nr:GntR family transcriptional regulator [Brevibacterium sp. S22]TGD27635.1 GntR family transcriptional regulator [Brevibacterium sp. S22]